MILGRERERERERNLFKIQSLPTKVHSIIIRNLEKLTNVLKNIVLGNIFMIKLFMARKRKKTINFINTYSKSTC